MLAWANGEESLDQRDCVRCGIESERGRGLCRNGCEAVRVRRCELK